MRDTPETIYWAAVLPDGTALHRTIAESRTDAMRLAAMASVNYPWEIGAHGYVVRPFRLVPVEPQRKAPLSDALAALRALEEVKDIIPDFEQPVILIPSLAEMKALTDAARDVCREFAQQHPLIVALAASIAAIDSNGTPEPAP